MTSAVIQEIEVAAIPSLIAITDALEQFDATMGTDPAQWGLKYPGAKLVLAGTILGQLPALAQAEGGAGVSALNAVYASWKATLQAKLPKT
jgi:hypothetical protein